MKRVSKRSGGTPELREERQNGCPSPLLLSRTPLKGRIKHFSELAATQSGRRDRERRRKGVRWSGLKVELIRGKGSDERNGMIFFHPHPTPKTKKTTRRHEHGSVRRGATGDTRPELEIHKSRKKIEENDLS